MVLGSHSRGRASSRPTWHPQGFVTAVHLGYLQLSSMVSHMSVLSTATGIDEYARAPNQTRQRCLVRPEDVEAVGQTAKGGVCDDPAC